MQNKLTFLGAAREVTGSCYLLESMQYKILLDCGMHQGGDTIKRMEKERFEFDPRSIDAVILSHAHLDHSGLLPLLVHRGFAGPVYCTSGTGELLQILLDDAFDLYMYALYQENKRRDRAGRKNVAPIYTEEDVRTSFTLCEYIDYGREIPLNSQISLKLYDAGHILGASIVELTINTGDRVNTVVFSGDLGNADSSLMSPPARVRQADVVLMESTYGDRNHRSLTQTIEELQAIIREAEQGGGNILIPAFAVARTQELLFELGRLYHQGLLDKWTVYLDSPMGNAVTRLYNKYFHQLAREDVALMVNEGSTSLTEFLPNLVVTESAEESIALNQIERGAIIIAGSGMCTGGRILHHFKHRLWRSNTHVLIVGYQAEGTLGRLLVDGIDKIMVFGQQIVVKARIHTLGGFSAHAGQRQLLEWAGAYETQPRLFLVHGEPDAMQMLSDELERQQNIRAEIPELGSVWTF